MKKKNLLMILALFVNSIVFSQKNDQFGLDSINKKLIDNKGKGFDSLIGCRNVRVVLKNLVYRGGNNNPLSVILVLYRFNGTIFLILKITMSKQFPSAVL
jgi:hypothetical protein